MATKKLLFAACIVAIVLICLDAARVSAQNPMPLPGEVLLTKRPPIDPVATISFRGGQSVTAMCRDRSFERVGLTHGQVVGIAVQYPVAKAGDSIVPEPLDGGKIIDSEEALVIDAEGMIYFRFQAGHGVGVYQVALHDGAQELGLQFWVLDELHPERNPAVVNPQTLRKSR